MPTGRRRRLRAWEAALIPAASPPTTTMRVRATAPPRPRLPEAGLPYPRATTEEASVARMLFHTTHGRDDPERAIVPFIAANAAAASGQDVLVVLTVEGHLAVQARLRGHRPGRRLPRLAGLLASFVEAGGRIWG